MRGWLKRRWKPYLTLLICAEAFGFLAGCANSFLLYPSTNPRDAAGAKPHALAIEGGKSLEIFTDRSPACGTGEPKAYVLEFCGNGTRAEDITAWLANQRWRQWPVEVWCLNYPGYGQSTGPAALKSIPPAALATYDSLRQTAGERPIILEANSLGSATAIYVATQRKTPMLIVQNPPPLKRLIMGRHGWWNLWLLAGPVALQVPTSLNTPDTAPKVPKDLPALFIQSGGDTIIPPNYGKITHEIYPGPKTVIDIPNIDHNDGIPAEYEKQIRAWIAENWTGRVERN
jgi:pimeloyl-ACP methyl ester carboxylesterase